jgi:glycosyltransferase involved in cell wall biosynthesis
VTRVLIDCTAIPVNRAGVGRYLEGLLSGLAELTAADSAAASSEQADFSDTAYSAATPNTANSAELEIILAVQHRDRESLAALIPTGRVVAIHERFGGRALRLLWEQFGLPALARSVSADVVHSPHYTFPVFRRGARVVTLHDGTFFSEPGVHGFVKRHFFRFWIRAVWRSRGGAITPSRATADDISAAIGEPRVRVEVAHLGVDLGTFEIPSDAAIAQFRSHVGLSEGSEWLAFLGTIEPRKNLGALLDAYEIVKKALGASTPPLLISGGRGWDEPVLARLDALEPDSGIHVLGYLPFEHLPALLGGAQSVVYPSLGEGFGLPVLEAMACGATVITTDRLAIPEVGGDAVAYTDVDAASIAARILEVLAHPQLRHTLGERATARAAQFSWRATAEHHALAYYAAAAA